MRKPQDVLVPLSLALVFAAACSRTHTDTSNPDPVTNPPPPSDNDRTGDDSSNGQQGAGATQTATPGTQSSLPPGATVEAPPERKTLDDELYGILETINDAAIKQGELGKQWSKSQKVKGFAADMIEFHRALNQRQESERDRLGLRSSDSKLSDDIEGNSDQKLDTLKEVPKGDDFDRSFVDVQVENYARWIDFVDNKLMPGAQMPDLRQELTETRAQLETRLNEAKKLQSSLAGGKAGDDSNHKKKK